MRTSWDSAWTLTLSCDVTQPPASSYLVSDKWLMTRMFRSKIWCCRILLIKDELLPENIHPMMISSLPASLLINFIECTIIEVWAILSLYASNFSLVYFFSGPRRLAALALLLNAPPAVGMSCGSTGVFKTLYATCPDALVLSNNFSAVSTSSNSFCLP